MNAKEEIDNLIAEHPDWRGAALKKIRGIILEADPEIVETWKWMGSPVWERDGIICVGNIFKIRCRSSSCTVRDLMIPIKFLIMDFLAISGG